MELAVLIQGEAGPIKITGRTWGPTDGPPVICVHGWLDNANSWALIAPRVAEMGFHVVSLDLSGHGMSDNVPRNFTLSWVMEILAVADCLGFTSFILMAHSMGAHIASALAGISPGRVEALVLVDAIAAFSNMSAGAAVKHLVLSVENRPRIRRRVRFYESFDQCVDKYWKNLKKKIDRESVVLLLQRGVQQVSTEQDGLGFQFRHDYNLLPPRFFPIRFREDELKLLLGRITCPVLLFWCDNQWYPVDPAFRDLRESYLPNPTVVKLSQAGHHIHMDDPDRVLQHLIPFLDQAKANGEKLVAKL